MLRLRVLSFEAEIEALRPRLGDAGADGLIARERREVFSVHPEVRVAAWAGALLIAAAVAILINDNFNRFDRRFLAGALALAVVACYAWAWRREGVVSDYVVLLGALILSADVGFIEQQFDLLGEAGIRHLLFLAIVHGVTAYLFDSRLVLSLSIGALAAWMGLEKRAVFDFGYELAIRAFACAAIVLAWRFLDLRFRGHVEQTLLSATGSTQTGVSALHPFARVFEHFAANLALWGGLALVEKSQLLGAVVTTAIGAVVIWWAYRARVESFLLYGFVYILIANTVLALKWASGQELLVILTAIVIAVPTLVFLHRSFRRGEA